MSNDKLVTCHECGGEYECTGMDFSDPKRPTFTYECRHCDRSFSLVELRSEHQQEPPKEPETIDRRANNYARRFNQIATAHGYDVPFDLCMVLVQLFAEVLKAAEGRQRQSIVPSAESITPEETEELRALFGEQHTDWRGVAIIRGLMQHVRAMRSLHLRAESRQQEPEQAERKA